ncbi:ATP-binding cassette domain-containing protein [Candidatus Neomarinimicrobiota bacterium]
MLTLKHLHKSFYFRPIIDDLSLTVNRGDVIGLMGKNGVGKSTLLRMIASLTSLDRGSVYYNGQELSSGRYDLRKHILYIGHSPGMYSALRAQENLSFAMRLYGKKADQDLILDTLKELDLAGQLSDPIQVYSQGMLQRLKLVYAKLIPWSVLLFDEPLTGLDSVGIKLVESILENWKAEGRTIILVAHDIDWVIKICNRLLILKDGSCKEDYNLQDTNNEKIIHGYNDLIA